MENDEELMSERAAIDRLNSEILLLLAERFAVVEHLSEIKYQMRLACHDPQRVSQMKIDLEAQWSRLPLSHQVPWRVIEPVFAAIFNSSAIQQMVSRNQKPSPVRYTTSSFDKYP